jgi:peptide/nickel transport system permease protein
MVRNAYNAGALSESYWWSMPPGIMISLTVLSSYLIARSVEADNADEGFM